MRRAVESTTRYPVTKPINEVRNDKMDYQKFLKKVLIPEDTLQK